MANSLARRVGIPGTTTAHWGEHLCAFFYTKADLLSLVVPYIKAGLEDNEFCLWITEENMEKEALHQAILTNQGDTWKCLDVRRRQATA